MGSEIKSNQKHLSLIKFFNFKPLNIYFYLILVLKLILLVLFSSEYNSRLFYRFLTSFIQLWGNPWQLFYENQLIDSFPYHALMLYLFTPFALISNILGVEWIFKIPLFIADLSIYFTLLRIFYYKQKEVFFYYYLNPIIFYSTFIHAQLDIITTAFLFFSIYLLISKRYKYSSIIFGLGLATKHHIILALPLMIFYIFKNKDIYTGIKFFLTVISIVFILDFPYLFSEGFIQMVILNQKQSLLFDSYYEIGLLKLLLPIASILLIYAHFFNQTKINDTLLFFYFGVLFTVTVLLIYPAPAWYVWMVPFVSIFFIKNKESSKTRIYYLMLSLSYLLFFIFFYESEYKDILFLNKEINFKIKNENFQNIFYTLSETVLLTIFYAFYKYGIKSNTLYNRQLNLTIGIGGDSGVGKTTLLKKLKDVLGDKLLHLEGDGDHKWERGDMNWNKKTHLDPKANFLHRQADFIYALKHNQIVYRRDYDHKTGRFTQPIKVIPKEFIVIVGLHPFYLPKLRKHIDLKIYIDTEEKIRRHWKILRDKKERGYKIEEILKQIENRMEDAKKYIYLQKEYADLVISYFSLSDFIVGKSDENIQLGLKMTFDSNIHVEEFLYRLQCNVEWDYNSDLRTQYIELTSPPLVDFRLLSDEFIDNLSEIVSESPIWYDGYDGFIQFFVLKMISDKLKYAEQL